VTILPLPCGCDNSRRRSKAFNHKGREEKGGVAKKSKPFSLSLRAQSIPVCHSTAMAAPLPGLFFFKMKAMKNMMADPTANSLKVSM
jgi:hypothetical protein